MMTSPLMPPLVVPFMVMVSEVAAVSNNDVELSVSFAMTQVPAITSVAFATWMMTLFDVTVVPMRKRKALPDPDEAGSVTVHPAAALIVVSVPACLSSTVVEAVMLMGARDAI